MANTRKSPCDLGERVQQALLPIVPDGSSLLLGLSGGLDSVVLLHLLAALAPLHGWRVKALHVHHGLSPHADDWAAWAVASGAALGIPVEVEQVALGALRAELGTEAAARQLRHAALNRHRTDFIVLAHHRDDQVETMLLQLLRGAGVRGAAAMAACQPRAGLPTLLRPLLETTRAELHAYALQHGLRWVEDESNADSRYARNFLRHRVLPVLELQFPAYRRTLARSARHFAEAAQLLEELAEIDAAAAIVEERLAIAALSKLNPARGRNLLRHFLHGRGAPLPDTSRLQEMWQQLRTGNADHAVCIAWQGWQLRVYRGHAYVLPPHAEVRDWECRWQGEAVLDLPQGLGRLHFTPVTGRGLARARLPAAGLTLRNRRGGERGLLDAMGRHLSLKKLLQSHAVPPWQRARLPLLFNGNELLAVADLAIAPAYAAGAGEAGIWLRWEAV